MAANEELARLDAELSRTVEMERDSCTVEGYGNRLAKAPGFRWIVGMMDPNGRRFTPGDDEPWPGTQPDVSDKATKWLLMQLCIERHGSSFRLVPPYCESWTGAAMVATSNVSHRVLAESNGADWRLECMVASLEEKPKRLRSNAGP